MRAVRLGFGQVGRAQSAEREHRQRVAGDAPGELLPAQPGGFRVRRRRLDRAEQRVIEPEFAGAGDLFGRVAGRADPFEIRSCIDLREPPGRQVQAVGA